MISSTGSGPTNPPWYAQAFQQEYLDLYLHRDLAEAARAVRFLSRVLALAPDHRLLDLCCGPGRHLTFLKERVGEALGLDLSAVLLRRAQAHGREVHGEAGPHGAPWLTQGDMRRLPLATGQFDRVVNLFTSFGYFDADAENEGVLREIARVLRPGGRLALDHINRATLLAGFTPRTERRLTSGTAVLEEREWDAGRARVSKRVTLTGADGSEKQWHESVRVYEADELEAVLRGAGLRPLARYGSYDGEPWSAAAPRLILLAERSAA